MTNLKKIILLSVLFSNFNAFAATVTPSLAGTVAIKGNVYTSGCQMGGSIPNYYLTIPVTFASDYKKGDISPLSSTKGYVRWQCPSASNVRARVDGNADTTDPTLFKITPGSGKATGVALRVIAEDVDKTGTFFQMVPNTLSTVNLIPYNNNDTYGVTFFAQAVAVSDKVTAGDLGTTLTYTLIYN